MPERNDPAAARVLAVPDLGGVAEATVLEVLVAPGQRIETEAALVTLESDKATMDVPATAAGVIRALLVKKGDRVIAGTALVELELELEPEPGIGAGAGADTPASAATRQALPDAAAMTIPTLLRSGEPYGGEPYVDTVPIRPIGTPAAAVPVVPAAPDPRVPEPPARPARDFDLVVLGAGPGGYTAAFRAADLGLSVALIERSPTLGGVCLNVGCIPSKALLHAARVIEEAADMAAHGIDFGPPRIDARRLRDWKDSVVARLTGGLESLARQRKVTVIHGEARFAGPQELEVDEGATRRRVSFAQCIVAAGSEPLRLPGLPDDPRLIDSTGALELDLPPSLLVVGGGIIGLEMATVYAALGVRVSVVELTPGLMPGCDRDLVRPLEKRIATRYEQILTGTRVVGVEPVAEGLRVSFEGERAPPEPVVYGKVLVAVGRRPNGHRIGADAAGLRVDERGFIPVDRQMRTNLPHVYAIGDVAGAPMLAHKATHEGKVAAEAAAGLKSHFDARVIPSVAYTDPEVAWVGLTETDARAQGVLYEKAGFPWAASGRSLAIGRDEGYTKLLFDPQSHRVLGGGIVGTGAGDLISEVALAIEMGADAADLALTIHPHPTLSETVAFAAEAFEGTLTDLYMPRRKGAGRSG